MDIYTELANGLLSISDSKTEEFIWCNDNGIKFGFKHRKNYSGLMAKINPDYMHEAKEKQGYFDIIGITGGWSNITHDTLLNELFKTTTIEECISIWRGEFPKDLSQQKKHILATLSILMFEQEINFGNEEWQRISHYAPSTKNPKLKRPRDLLMGYINMIFKNKGDTECLNELKNKNGLLLPPLKNSEVRRKYFDTLQNDPYAEVLMTGSNLERFRECIAKQPINSYKKRYYENQCYR